MQMFKVMGRLPLSDRVEIFQYKGAGERLDKFLVTCLPEFSRARLQGLIVDGFVDVNGHPAKKGGVPLGGGERVTVRIPPTQSVGLVAENIPLDVVYENDE